MPSSTTPTDRFTKESDHALIAFEKQSFGGSVEQALVVAAAPEAYRPADKTLTTLKKRWVGILSALLILSQLSVHAIAQSGLPSKVAISQPFLNVMGYEISVFPMQGTDSQGRTVYARSSEGTTEQGYAYVTIDGSGNATISDTYTGYVFSAATNQFTFASSGTVTTDVVAVSDDGNSVLGLPACVQFRGTFWEIGVPANDYLNQNHYADLVYGEPDGTFLQVWTSLPDGDVFEIENSPWYQFSSSNGNLLLSSFSWPPSNLLSTPPTQLWVNGVQYPFDGQGGSPVAWQGWFVGGGRYWEVQFGITPSGYYGYVYDPENGSELTFNPPSLQIFGAPPGWAISFSPPSSPGTPNIGPPQISWNGAALSLLYTANDGSDVYQDSSMALNVTISPNGVVSATGPVSATGTCSLAPSFTFNFNGASGMTNFFALDSAGNPLGLPAGLLLLFGNAGNAQSILGQDGTVWYPTYTFQGNGGPWGVEYVGLPSGYIYVVADNGGNYSSPVYQFSGNTVINTVANGWPPTTMPYPQAIYLDSYVLTLDPVTERDNVQNPYPTVKAGSHSIALMGRRTRW